MKRILIADDDESIRWVLRKTVTGMGFAADLAEDGEQALALLGKNTYAAAFVDIRMPGVEGIEVLERVEARKSPTRFFIMTAVRRPDVAARSTRAGAAEFITKPFDLSRIEELLRNVASEASSRESSFRPEEQEEWSSARIVGKSRVLLELFQSMGKVADSDATILLLGQRGVGKELIARCIHELGGRTGPFVAVNIPAIPRDLQEAELFGHEKGAFTGAESARQGKLAAAMDGTLFLDEIGDTPLDLQAKLLRVLQEREYTPVGSNQPRAFRGGIIAATNRDLRKMVADGKFREDLFDRLNVFPLRVPSLSRGRRTSRCWRTTSCKNIAPSSPARRAPSRRRRSRSSPPARGRGTCGNSRTSSSAWRSSPRENCCGATTWCASWPGRKARPRPLPRRWSSWSRSGSGSSSGGSDRRSTPRPAFTTCSSGRWSALS